MGSIANIYYAPASAGSNNGTSCANAYAYTDGTNGWSIGGKYGAGGTQIGSDTQVHICSGTYTAASNGNIIIIQGDGTSGHPITFISDQGVAVFSSPNFNTTNGAIKAQNRSFIVINGVNSGGNSLTIQNTDNGDTLGHQVISTGIAAFGCTTCVFENLTIANIYVAAQQVGTVNTNGTAVTWVSGTQFNTNWITGIGGAVHIGASTFTIASVNSATSLTLTATAGVQNGVSFAWALGAIVTQMNAIQSSGTNNIITGLTVHDCGWCLYLSYAANNTNLQVFNNEVYNWDHASNFSTGGANACIAPCLIFHDNNIHDNINWETPTCVYHEDGLHAFGSAGSSMDGLYIYNNWWHGTLTGACSSGWLFSELGGSAATASNTFVWNNVFDASGADGPNPNGWIGWFSGVGGVTQFFNNYVSGPQVSDTTVCWNIAVQGTTALTIEDNIIRKCSQGPNINTGSGVLTIDYNTYVTPCANSNNCFHWTPTNTFTGSFAAWKTACSCDSHSQVVATDGAVLLNSDGSPQIGSPVISFGLNLSSFATGNLTTLQSDTTKALTRVPILRPSGGTPWDGGAYQFSSAVPPPPAPAVNMLIGKLQWKPPADDIDHYNAYLGTDCSTLPENKNLGNVLHYSERLKPGNSYAWAVTAVDTYGQESNKSKCWQIAVK